MEYTVKQLSSLAGVSTRTLRYYDEIGILNPARINSSGYRIYGQKEVDKLQQILFFRELEVSLDRIKEIVSSPGYDEAKTLREHREELIAKRNKLDVLLDNLEKTIKYKEGKLIMSDKEKFEGFKKRLVEDNEKKFGEEVKKKYGEEAFKKSNSQFLNMTEDQYKSLEDLGKSVLEKLDRAYETGDPAGALAQEAADLHRQWLTFCWGDCSREAHANIAQMYVDDERFSAYYDRNQPGKAEFLRDAVFIYTGRK
jgi:DNA-binding transcriptional MerR regulator